MQIVQIVLITLINPIILIIPIILINLIIPIIQIKHLKRDSIMLLETKNIIDLQDITDKLIKESIW